MQFCDDKYPDDERLDLHSEIRWLTKGNYLIKFMTPFGLGDLLTEKSEMKHLLK